MFLLYSYTIDGIAYCVLTVKGGWVLMAFYAETGFACTKADYDLVLDIHQGDRRT